MRTSSAWTTFSDAAVLMGSRNWFALQNSRRASSEAARSSFNCAMGSMFPRYSVSVYASSLESPARPQLASAISTATLANSMPAIRKR
jgi:hypothetical protein